MNEEAHKVCPFCGSGTIRVTSKGSYMEVLERKGKASVTAQCARCSCTVYQLQKETPDVKVYEERVKLLWEKWDRRV